MVKITGEYTGELHCNARHEPSGNVLSTDAPKDNQGRGEAFSPTDLIATGYVTCIATTLALGARKHGVELTRIRYEVTKEMATDAPRRISRLVAKLWMPAEAQRVPEAVAYLTRVANNCPVHHSLAPSIEKVIEFVWE